MVNNDDLFFNKVLLKINFIAEREQLKEKSISQFRNAISFMGGVYCNLKLNGKPMDILTIPLLHYLELLLDTSEEEDIELVTVQV